jgi:hypothetical protein
MACTGVPGKVSPRQFVHRIEAWSSRPDGSASGPGCAHEQESHVLVSASQGRAELRTLDSVELVARRFIVWAIKPACNHCVKIVQSRK